VLPFRGAGHWWSEADENPHSDVAMVRYDPRRPVTLRRPRHRLSPDPGDRSTPVACRPAPSTFGLTPLIACHLVDALLHVVGHLRERPSGLIALVGRGLIRSYGMDDTSTDTAASICSTMRGSLAQIGNIGVVILRL